MARVLVIDDDPIVRTLSRTSSMRADTMSRSQLTVAFRTSALRRQARRISSRWRFGITAVFRRQRQDAARRS